MAKDKQGDSSGLGFLLSASPQARQYFDSLPQYVQEMIVQRRESIKSEDELHRYAGNLTQGDK